jgi:hypothetical protein
MSHTVPAVDPALRREGMPGLKGKNVLVTGGFSGEPGPGLELAEWLADRGVALTGCDTWSYGRVPPEDPARPFAVPQHLNVHHGVSSSRTSTCRRSPPTASGASRSCSPTPSCAAPPERGRRRSP